MGSPPPIAVAASYPPSSDGIIESAMVLRKRFLVLWSIWIALGASIEAAALRRKETGDTLTELVRFVLGIHPVIWWGAMGLWVWATRHFFFGAR